MAEKKSTNTKTEKKTKTSQSKNSTNDTLKPKRKYTKRAVNNTSKNDVDSVTNNILDNIKLKDGNGITSNKQVKNALKKIPNIIKVIGIVLFLIGGVLGGYVGYQICKNDTFELIPYNSTFDIGFEGTLDIPKAKIISYGKDISNKVTMELSEGLTKNQDGTISIDDTSIENSYYIIYKVDDLKFGKIQKIRYIYVNDFDDIGESIAENE